MKQFLFLFILIISTTNFNLIAQDTSAYHSQYEQEVFEKLADSTDLSALEIMIALDYEKGNETDIPDQINALYENLIPEKLKSKKTKKQISSIFSEIHDAKLKKYIIDADFNQLFSKGEYNCVSATALYAQILNRFEIDYEIRETPTHVYLVADPKGEKILMETTLPQNGTIEYDYKTKKEYVNYLVSNKLISEEEYENTSIEKLFDEYYDTNKVIDDKQLAALLYYNKGVGHYNLSEFKKAIFYLEKAYRIYPSTNIHFITNYALVGALAKCESSKEFDPMLLANLVNLNGEGSQFANLGLEHFALVSNELMVVRPNQEAFHKYYNSFKIAVDTADISGYELQYHGQLANLYTFKRNYPEALHSLNIVYQINPENLQVKESIFNNAAKHMMNDRSHERNLDSLEKYFQIFPFLNEDERVSNYYNYSQMRIIREHFNYGKVDKGLIKLAAFEEKLKNNGVNENVDRNYFAEIYIDLANHYLRKENINKATNSLKRGLELDPNSSLLKDRYQTMYRVKAEYNQNRANLNAAMQSGADSFEEQFDKYFIACWENDGSLTRDNKEGGYDKTFKIMSYKDNKLTYVVKGKTFTGKYSFRKKSKLLYLIPNTNKDNYIIFKINRISNSEMILMPFKNDKLTGEKIYMSHC